MLGPQKITLLLFFPFLLNIAVGQNVMFDSLAVQFLDERLPDRTRLDALIALGEDTGILSTYPDSIVQYYEQANPLITKIGTTKDLMMQKLHLGRVFFVQTQLDKSLIYEEDAANLARISKDTLVLIKALMWQGNVYHRRNLSELATEKYLEALQLSESINYPIGISKSLTNLAGVFQLLDDHDQALIYLTRSLEIQLGQENTHSLINTINQIAFSHQKKGNHEESINYFLQAIEKAAGDAIVDDPTKAFSLLHISRSYRLLKDFETAKKYLTAAEALQVNNTYMDLMTAEIRLERGYLYADLVNLDSAMYYANEVNILAEELESLTLFTTVKQLLAYVYEQLGDFEKAVEEHKGWKKALDSLNENQGQEGVYRASARYEYEKKQLTDQYTYQQTLTQQQIQGQRWVYFAIISFIVFVFLLVVLLNYRQRTIKQERQQLLQEVELWKSRLANQLVTSSNLSEVVQLDREKIEQHLEKRIGESSWKILIIIFENPSISNKDLAAQVHLSMDGLSSALRRMYKTFQVHTESNQNKKVALISKAVQLSLHQEKATS